MKSNILLLGILAVFAGFVAASGATAEDSPNILFIAIDDLNDWTGFLGGHPQAQTPQMDRLARRGVNFTNAHCVSPACSPSRNAVLFGVEPFKSGLYPFYDLDAVPETVLAKYISLPQFLRENGYATYGAGKIHHGSRGNPEEWTDFFPERRKKLHYAPEEGFQVGTMRQMAFCPTTDPLEVHPDHQTASYGVKILSSAQEQPFFLAVGIIKPHLAFVCPREFFERYPASVDAPRIKEDDLLDVPWAGRAMSKFNDDSLFRSEDAWERVRRAYLACVSWADFNVGRVLEALESGPHANNTVVVLWSDHGFHLGEKRSFRKFSLWEEATRVPFIVWDTRESDAPKGRTCGESVSLIHIYRTIADFAGLTPPDYVDGFSLRPQVTDPSVAVDPPAVTTWGRGNYAARDEEWRYIRYFDGTEELYSHREDPDEWKNLAADAGMVEIKRRLSAYLPKEQDEAPLIEEGITEVGVVDADHPDLSITRKAWIRYQPAPLSAERGK